MMRPNFIFLTIFPKIFHDFFRISIIKKAYEKKLFNYSVFNIRDFSIKGIVDDSPYGGGKGMLIKIDSLIKTISVVNESFPFSYFILLSPQGERFTQKDVMFLLEKPNLVFICGRYEGFDERINYYIDKKISIGDFVTMGGEMPSLVIVETLIRAIPGVIKKESFFQESFTDFSFDFPNYTRPSSFDGISVPSILLSGNHRKIKN